jgi:hypothetical protein
MPDSDNASSPADAEGVLLSAAIADRVLPAARHKPTHKLRDMEKRARNMRKKFLEKWNYRTRTISNQGLELDRILRHFDDNAQEAPNYGNSSRYK